MKKHKFPKRNIGYSLKDYYLALKYRNLDKENEALAWGIIHVVDDMKKAGMTKGQIGLLRSIMREHVKVVAAYIDNEVELTVTSINMPNDLKPAFLPKGKPQQSKSTSPERTTTR